LRLWQREVGDSFERTRPHGYVGPSGLEFPENAARVAQSASVLLVARPVIGLTMPGHPPHLSVVINPRGRPPVAGWIVLAKDKLNPLGKIPPGT
jgi:hypothetical protein